jgi:hypothetical protein
MFSYSVLDDFPFGVLHVRVSDGGLLYGNAPARKMIAGAPDASINSWKITAVKGSSVCFASTDGMKLRFAGSWADDENDAKTRLFVMHLAPLSERLRKRLQTTVWNALPHMPRTPPVPAGSAAGKSGGTAGDTGAEWQSACFRALVAAVENGEKAVVIWDAISGAVSSVSGHLERWRAPAETLANMRDWAQFIHPVDRETVTAAHQMLADAQDGHDINLTYHLLGRYKGIKAVRERAVRLPSPNGTALVLTMWEPCKLSPPKLRPEDLPPPQQAERAFRVLGREHGFSRILLWKEQDNGDFAVWASWRAKQVKPVAEYILPCYQAERLFAALLPGGMIYTVTDLPGLSGLDEYGIRRFMAVPVGENTAFLLLCVDDDWNQPEARQRLDSQLKSLTNMLEQQEKEPVQ